MNKISCHMASDPKQWENKAREEITALTSILEWFNTDEGFESYTEWDRIGILVGKDLAITEFCPITWEAAEYFIKFSVCHLIVANDFESFPYYAQMLERYSNDLKGNMEQNLRCLNDGNYSHAFE